MGNPGGMSNETGHFIVGLNMLLFVGILTLCMFMNLIVTRINFHWIPESGLAMLLGFFIGGVILLANAYKEESVVIFEPEVFFFVILPPIILEAGFSMKRRNFFRNMTTILLYAVFGTLISTAIVGYGLFGLSNIGMLSMAPQQSALELLSFGALISAVDPVATLAILGSKRVNADEMLYSLVFGESVLNDAVSIVLFKTFTSIIASREASAAVAGEAVGAASLWEVIGSFFGISMASLGIGVLIALLSAILFKELNFEGHHEYEFVLICFFAYAAYCVSEILALSGIMALFFCGILMAHYTCYNMDEDAVVTTRLSLKGIAMVCETFLFVYLGITAVLYLRPEFHLHWNGSMIFFTVVLCILARAIQIFFLSFLANLGRKRKVPFKMQLVMIFSGLRGAIAFALSLNVATPNRASFVTTTMSIVILTTLGCGGLTLPLLKKLGLANAPIGGSDSPHEQPMLQHPREKDDEDDSQDDDDDVIPAPRTGGLHYRWKHFDTMYMQQWFGGRTNPLHRRKPPTPAHIHRDAEAARHQLNPLRNNAHARDSSSRQSDLYERKSDDDDLRDVQVGF